MVIDDSNVTTEGTSTCESGTTTTNIKVTGHDFDEGDILYNRTRNTKTVVTAYVDANNVTVNSVTGQTTSDVIVKYTDAQLIANNALLKYGKALPKTIDFDCATTSIFVNTVMYVDLSMFGASGTGYYLVESVEYYNFIGSTMRTRVKATLRGSAATGISSQPSQKSADYFKAMAQGGSSKVTYNKSISGGIATEDPPPFEPDVLVPPPPPTTFGAGVSDLHNFADSVLDKVSLVYLTLFITKFLVLQSNQPKSFPSLKLAPAPSFLGTKPVPFGIVIFLPS
jgi:hypothetical protein